MATTSAANIRKPKAMLVKRTKYEIVTDQSTVLTSFGNTTVEQRQNVQITKTVQSLGDPENCKHCHC
jgi:hypothetical protein